MSTPSLDELTPTSYAMLGLLTVRSWTTYELAKQMQRSVRWFWPRAERKLYDEPKRLAALGLAEVRQTMTGRRASTVYEITPAGRAALRAWLSGGPGAPPQFELEDMIRVFFADSGTPDQLRANLRGIGERAGDTLAELGTMATATAASDDYPERRATNAVAMELWVRLYETVAEWSTWAEHEVEGWPAQRRGGRKVAAGPPERGTALFAAMAARSGQRP
jgi:PadR family transcriptional regulator, regulatory protein AphA